MTPSNRRTLGLMTLIFLLAFASRLVNIDAESLWVDEGFSYWAIRHDDMLRVILNDVHPPIYFYGLRAWAEAAGISELALRFFSLIPSVLSVAVIYCLAHEVEGSRGNRQSVVPILAALLLALADMETYMAQTIRMYALHVLWVTASFWLFLRWQRLRTRSSLIAWTLANLLLVYTHYLGVAALAVQGLYALIFLRGRGRMLAVGALALVGGLFAPWMLVVVGNQTGNVGTGFNVPSTLASLWAWRENWFTGQWALMLCLALLGLVAVLYGEQGDDDEPQIKITWASSALLLLWVIVPIAGAYILNRWTPILMDYRLTQITPGIVVLFALGLGNLRGGARLFLVAVIILYGVSVYDTPRPRPPWREVGQNAARYAQVDDLALAHVTPSGDWQVIYYYERFMPEVERRSLRQWQLEEGDTYAEGLPALVNQYPTVWLMHWSKDNSSFEALAQTGHVQTAVMTEDWLGNDLNVYRFDQVPPVEDAITRYESGLILRAAEILVDDFRVDLLWSADAPLTHDDTISVILLNAEGRLIAQDDAQPFRNERPTTTFAPGEVVYDPHPLRLAEGVESIPPGTYTVGVKTYRFTPEGGIEIIPTSDGAEYAVIGAASFSEEITLR